MYLEYNVYLINCNYIEPVFKRKLKVPAFFADKSAHMNTIVIVLFPT